MAAELLISPEIPLKSVCSLTLIVPWLQILPTRRKLGPLSMGELPSTALKIALSRMLCKPDLSAPALAI